MQGTHMITLNDYHIMYTKKMFELDKKFVKFKLLYEEKEYAIIITRRAAEQRSQSIVRPAAFLSVEK